MKAVSVANSKRTSAAFRAIFVAVAMSLALTLVFALPDVAYAELSPSYVEAVQQAGNEWQEDILQMSAVKQTVESWFSNEMYDFSRLDDDPIIVAVIDSGVNVSHEAFTGSYGEGTEYDVLYRDNQGKVVGKNTVSGSSNVADVSKGGHGTHVAGIVADMIHWLGLEKYIKIMPIMAGEASGEGASFKANDVIEGIQFALEKGADVVNLSLESDKRDFQFVSEEWASKAIFVAAAGNGRTVGGTKVGYDSAKQVSYPAADEQVIGVMNISNERDADNNLQLSVSSNFGDAYDLCAPGSMIYSASGGASDYIAKSGTSMAAPIVSFASALALLKFRAIEAATQIAKTVDEVREIVKFASTTYIIKGDYRLSVLDMRKLVSSDDSVLARVDMESGLERQSLGNVKSIPVSLRVLPESLQGMGRVEWRIGSLDGEKVGEGFDFVFTPQNVRGKQYIYAIWTLETNDGETKSVTARHTITVDYARLTSQTIEELKIGVSNGDNTVLESVVFEEGASYAITFDGADNYDPDVCATFKWLVNGEIRGVGKQFNFTPDAPGTYEISLRAGSRESKICTVRFDSGANLQTNKIIEYVSYGIIALGVVAIVAMMIVRSSKRRKADSERF